jgi:hydrogenase/urease accessory protein HupE
MEFFHHKMKTGWLPVLLVLLGHSVPASAHRLDEYLQATTISVQTNKILLQMHLTPGVSVAAGLLAEIHPSHTETISDAEKIAYAEKVGRDVSLTVDGHPAHMRLVSYSFPELDLMTNGLGEILLKFEAQVPTGGKTRRITLENRHESSIAAYLVNTLIPDDPAIRILGQQRNYNQSFYQLDYASSDSSAQLAAAAPIGIKKWLQQTGNMSVLESYFIHGVRHILTGYDHLLFICALVLAATTFWDLLKVVTAFTVAHTLTLTLAALNWVHLPGTIVEPLISASIVFVAVQNIFWPSHTKGWSRIGVAFFFGLFHGLGFAGGLLDAMHEMPPATVLLALAGFSVGVEFGHQLVVLPVFGFLKLLRRSEAAPVQGGSVHMAFLRAGSAAISLAGLYYLTLALKSA